jgi:hypothetical protein
MTDRIIEAMSIAENKAWQALSGYKFWMFGYHAARWINYNNLLDRENRKANPFIVLVKMARLKIDPVESAALDMGDTFGGPLDGIEIEIMEDRATP